MWIYFLIAAIVILDQISKFIAAAYLQHSAAISAIPRFLSFYYHENRGAAWGMLADHRWVFMLVSTVAIVGILAYLIFSRKVKTPLLFRISLAFFCGGGIGNMIDRIRLEYVIDFIRFDFIDFPIFNVADSFITVGACLMVLQLILETIRDIKLKKVKEKAPDKDNGNALR